MSKTSVHRVLGALAEFDYLGGGSMSLVAWELFVPERSLWDAWAYAVSQEWVRKSGRGDDGEQLWRLTPAGWAARFERRPRLEQQHPGQPH